MPDEPRFCSDCAALASGCAEDRTCSSLFCSACTWALESGIALRVIFAGPPGLPGHFGLRTSVMAEPCCQSLIMYGPEPGARSALKPFQPVFQKSEALVSRSAGLFG